MNDLARLAIVAAAFVPVLGISLLTRAARQRAELSRDQHADWLRSSVPGPSHNRSVSK